VFPLLCAAGSKWRIRRRRNDESVSVLVGRPVQIDPGKLPFLVDVSPARRCALLSAALSFFFPRSSTLSAFSARHTCCHNPDLVLPRALAFWVAHGGISGRAGNVLSRANGWFSLYRLLHLRRAVRVLLFRLADLLRSHPRERRGAASGPTGDLSGTLRLRA